MTAAAPSKGASILAQLTAEVMADKKAEARKLTPVEGEAGARVVTKASFPNDMPIEVVMEKANELTRIIGHLTEARDAMLSLAEAPLPAEVIDLAAIQKEKEAKADAEFAAKFAAKQAEAQAAVFKQPEPEPGQWVCPSHGVPGIAKTSQKTGREFIGCPECNLFQRT